MIIWRTFILLRLSCTILHRLARAGHKALRTALSALRVRSCSAGAGASTPSRGTTSTAAR